MKFIIKLLVILALGVVALMIAGYFLLPPAAKKAASEGSEYAFGVPATLSEIGASPGVSNTSFGFQGYELQSPGGIEEPLLKIGKFDVGVGTKSIIGSTKDVGAFTLENVELTIVQDGLSSNLYPVLQHLSGLSKKGGAESTETAEGEPGPGPKLKVGTIKVSGVAGRIIVRGAGPANIDQRFEIPAYEKDLSSVMGTEGKTVAEIAGLLVTDLKDRALASAEGVVPAPALSVLDKALSGGLDGGLEGLIDGGKGAVKDQIDAGKEAVGDKVDDLKGSALDEASKLKGEAKKLEDDLKGKAGDLLKGGDKKLDKSLDKLFGGKGGQ